MTILYSISNIASILAMVFYLHPIHVSVTEIEHDEKDKRLEIMMRVFVDDVELTFRQKYNQPDLDILEPKNGLSVDQMMGEYLKDHFKISLDNKPQKINLLGHEKESEAFIFYIEVTNVKKFKTIHVLNDIITDMHDDQSNLVHVTVKGTVKSLRLTRDTPADNLTFDVK
jgi:hypothetical protein